MENHGLCDQHGQTRESQGVIDPCTRPSRNKCSQQEEEPSKSTKEQELQTKDNLTLNNINTDNSCRMSSKSIEKTTKIRHKCSANADNALSGNSEYDDDDKDVIVRQLRNGCDKVLFDQKQNFGVFSDESKNVSLNNISSEENLKENILKRPSTTPTQKTDTISGKSSPTVVPLTGQNATKTKESKKVCSENDIIEQFANQRLEEASTIQCVKGVIREIDLDDLQQNHNSIGPYFDSRNQQSGLRQQLLNVDDEPSPCTHTKTTTPSSTEIIAHEGATITRSLSLSSQKTGVALKTQSLESRPIYPNVPYSPYASPYSSPRTNRRRPPLRESRRVSIEQTGSFLQLNQYKLMDQIGQGSYGLVKLAYSEEDSTHYAMKILSKRRLLRQAGLMKRGPKRATSPLDRVYREIAVLKKLDHPNVVKLVEVLDDPVEDSLYMVFELVKQGEVLSVPTKNPLSEERVWSVFRDTLLGLEYLHYQRIIHGDIKPGNLLLTECGRVKIADLGVCNEFSGEDATITNGSMAGTPAFRAPESLNMGQNIYCGKAADIWALGATLYALVYGNVPFVASTIPVLYEKIKTEEFSFPDNPKTTAELRDCIQSMLKKDPADRLTLPQLKEHIWVTAGGLHPLPSEEENCRLVQVNDDDISTVVRSIPKLDTLILIKTMLKNHSFGNPFSRGISGRAPQRGGSRLERFIRAGRSNSAPGSYNMIVDRQLSGDSILPALCEHSPTSCINEETQ